MAQFKCQNHPAANAIEQCAQCKAPLCGMCCSFDEQGVFCEKCYATVLARKKIEEETRKRAAPQQDIGVKEDTPVSKKERDKQKDKMVVWAVIIAFVAIGAVQLYRYGNPSGVGISAEEQARNQQLISMVQCAAVYRQIGLLISDSQEVPSDLMCAAQQRPHIVTQAGDVVKYAFPNPELYGYTEISVTSSNPQPNMIKLAN